MLLPKELHDYLCNNIDHFTEEWYETLDKSVGVYGSTDSQDIQRLKNQNKGFHIQFCEILDPDNGSCLENFESWISSIAKDQNHLDTPIYKVIDEFYRTQSQYVALVRKYSKNKDVSLSETLDYTEYISDLFNKIIVWFIREYAKESEFKLIAQQEMILELSTPVISLTQSVALLPLVGEIDTRRAQHMMDSVLQECGRLGVDHLFIDMSGVVVIDTMVAHRIFTIVKTLKLIGVETIISGIRPEIAQTSTHLGIPLHEIKTTSSLQKSIEKIMLQDLTKESPFLL
ncbi:hypothetical protein CHH91_15975 [Virgibacillus sp. 7505]|uniref:STAS domain-containing protein n=1 Tax=Virgibacillus sp. 7505 TaxID=2022548 RepID=UPI000BA4EE4F|nr:STAS domain-containing protein [Virgibacillus sp. 7505]PAE15232.1 hypothetical protein CHH91_15975 [Virgibacillus sp. 7505]